MNSTSRASPASADPESRRPELAIRLGSFLYLGTLWIWPRDSRILKKLPGFRAKIGKLWVLLLLTSRGEEEEEHWSALLTLAEEENGGKENGGPAGQQEEGDLWPKAAEEGGGGGSCCCAWDFLKFRLKASTLFPAKLQRSPWPKLYLEAVGMCQQFWFFYAPLPDLQPWHLHKLSNKTVLILAERTSQLPQLTGSRQALFSLQSVSHPWSDHHPEPV
ncbi:uncharacterized protein LOC115074262 [Rhinatrema bivittatum]|uniref:uncharacterized protein LOC115074262 n=1 Tax=Rhinatrema bivittatum TaxID=194408 RepID=UPI00112E2DF6|nr:uncharacterized protein LOC115074262 [Rhinatrema bivittatum]